MKYINIQFHFIQNYIEKNIINIKYYFIINLFINIIIKELIMNKYIKLLKMINMRIHEIINITSSSFKNK